MRKGQCEFAIDKFHYKNVGDLQYIEIVGWIFSHDNESVAVEVEIDGQKVECQTNDRYDRKDLIRIYKLAYSAKNSGFEVKVDTKGKDVKTVAIYGKTSKERILLNKYNQKKIKKLEDNSYIEYEVGGFGFDEKTDLCSVMGWAYSLKQTEMEYEVKDASGNSMEYTFRVLERLDFPDEYRRRSGFYIAFKGEKDAQYYLHIKSDGMMQVVNLKKCGALANENQPSMAARVVSLAKQVNPKSIKKAGAYFKNHGCKQFVRRIIKGKPTGDMDYDTWARIQLATEDQLKEQRRIHFALTPKVSIIVATFNTPMVYLKEMIETVEAQTYSNWELCIADGSTDDQVENYVKEHYGDNEKIRFTRLAENYGIAGNMNKAMDLATGDFIALYDHDDTLTPDALYENIKLYNEHPDALMIYSDEDKMNSDGSKFFNPHFKPDFNYDLLCSNNYICHFLLIKKTLIDKMGQLDGAYDGAQDFEFVLRLSEEAGEEHIYHIPRVIYHWRIHENSTAGNPESKMYAFEAGKRAVEDYFKKKEIPVEVEHGPALGIYRVKYILQSEPLVSILIPNKDHIEDLDRCIQSIETKCTYKNIEYIIIENNSTEEETFAYYKKLEKENSKVKVVYWKGEFNYSAINNFGRGYAKGEYLLLLNNDTEIINENDIEELLGFCMRQDVGAVGARLYYPDDTIQHGGVIIGMQGIAGHAFVNQRKEDLGYFARVSCQQDISAVTAACLMVKASVYDEVGGLNEELKVAFNDIDFCLKIREAGYKIVYNPYCELYHFESKSRGSENNYDKLNRFNGEITCFENRWRKILTEGDPYYNPNLSLDIGGYKLKEN